MARARLNNIIRGSTQPPALAGSLGHYSNEVSEIHDLLLTKVENAVMKFKHRHPEIERMPELENTIVDYSFSKSLSLPGDRIGYLVIPSEIDYYGDVFAAAGVATRILGFVNAPSLAQLFVSKCLDEKVDLEIYNRNRELLYNSLRQYGYECIKPEGAFYLFVKAFEPDDRAFAAKAKEKRLLIVPGSTFGCAGYVRIAYCVDYDMIKRSLPAFEALARDYKRC